MCSGIVTTSSWSRHTQVVYNQVAKEGRVAQDAKGGSRGLQNAAMHLRKACNHPYLFLPEYEPEDPEELVRASGKLELLDRILPKLKATGHRVLLFSQMTRALDILQDFLNMRGFKYDNDDARMMITYACVVVMTWFRRITLHSATCTWTPPCTSCLPAPGTCAWMEAPRQRSEATCSRPSTRPTATTFSLCCPRGPVGSASTCRRPTRSSCLTATGTRGSTCLTHLQPMHRNPQADLQAEDRAHRIGQKKEVLVLVLVTAGTIEEAILDKAKQKREIDAKVIQAGMFNDNSTHEQRQAVLKAIMARGAGDSVDSVHDEGEVNEMLARSPEEYALFCEMDEGRVLTRPRLLTTEEVPSWVVAEPEAEAQSSEPEETGGRRLRKRRRGGQDYRASEAELDWYVLGTRCALCILCVDNPDAVQVAGGE